MCRNVGSIQKMIFQVGERPHKCSGKDAGRDFTGVAKGLRQVLWERGWDCDNLGMKGKKDVDGIPLPNTCAPKIMAAQSDFQWEPCALSNLITKKGHLCLFTPKFHPELNFIERAWGRAKWFLRLFCDCTFPGLKARAGIALGVANMTNEQRRAHPRLADKEKNLSLTLIRMQARRSRDYVTMYCNNDSIRNLTTKDLQKVKRHRSPPERENHLDGEK